MGEDNIIKAFDLLRTKYIRIRQSKKNFDNISSLYHKLFDFTSTKSNKPQSLIH